MLQSISKYRLYLYLFFFIFLSSVFNFQFLKNYHDRFSLKVININGLSINEKKTLEIDLKANGELVSGTAAAFDAMTSRTADDAHLAMYY